MNKEVRNGEPDLARGEVGGAGALRINTEEDAFRREYANQIMLKDGLEVFIMSYFGRCSDCSIRNMAVDV